MRDERLIEPDGVLEIYVDDFINHKRRYGNMTCDGVRDLSEGRTVVVRLIWPAVNTVAAIDDAVHAMAEQPDAPVAHGTFKGRTKPKMH